MQTGTKGAMYHSNAGPIKAISPAPPLAAKNGTVSDALRSLEGAWATQQKAEPGTSCLEVLVGAQQDAGHGVPYAALPAVPGQEKLTVVPNYALAPALLVTDPPADTFEGDRDMLSPGAAGGTASHAGSVVLAAADHSGEANSQKQSRHAGLTLSSRPPEQTRSDERVGRLGTAEARQGLEGARDQVYPVTNDVSRQTISMKHLEGSNLSVGKAHHGFGLQTGTGTQPALLPHGTPGYGTLRQGGGSQAVSGANGAGLEAGSLLTPAAAPDSLSYQKSVATIPRHDQETRRQSASGQTDAPRTQDDRTKKTEATRCADGNVDEQTKSDASKITNIHVARIEKTQSRDRRNMRALGSDEEPGKQDRFSSQGQEELLQAYQRPPAQQAMEAYAGVGKPQFYSQKRNYTSYGGQRRAP